MQKLFIIGAVLIGAVWFISIFPSSETTPAQNKASSEPDITSSAIAPTPAEADAARAPAPTKESLISVPIDERSLISAVVLYQARYKAASNEFQKSTLRRERAAELAMIAPDYAVDEWIGKISRMETTSDGSGVLSVKPLGSDLITIATHNNSFSDIDAGTLIPNRSPLYEQISSLSVGQMVIFSGKFLAGRLDYLEEMSLTEAGSMGEPSFIFKFTSIHHIQ